MKHFSHKKSVALLPFAVFLLAALIFGSFSYLVSNQLSYSKKLFMMQDEGKIRPLANWHLSMQACTQQHSSQSQDCELVQNIDSVNISDPEEMISIIQSVKDNSPVQHVLHYNAVFSRTFSASEQAWLRQNPHSSFVMPSFVGSNIRLTSPFISAWQVSAKGDFQITLPQSYDGTTPLTFQVLVAPDVPWIGMQNYQPALVQWRSVNQYADIDQMESVLHYLQRMNLVILPLLITALVIILNHAPTMLLLSYVGLIYAGRVLFSSLYEYSGQTTQLPLGLVLVMLYALTPILLTRFALYLGHIRLSTWVIVLATAVSIGINIGVYLFDAKMLYVEKGGLWNDAIAAFLALGTLVFSLVHRTRALSGDSSDDLTLSSLNARLFSLGLAGSIFALSMVACVHDILLPQDNSFSAWTHQLLLPALFLVGLIHMGSIVNTIRRVSRIVQEKTRIDRDIEIGKELQSGILPDKKFKNSHLTWHAFHYPAAHLAGDWFDLRWIETANERSLLIACVVDVTGHGISSAMMTSNIASHWGLWTHSLRELEISDDLKEREDILTTAPQQIHRGLIGLRYNLGCSMACMIYEPQKQIFTYLTAGHPGLIVSEGHSFRYLTSQGTRPGITHGESGWQARSLVLDQTPQQIILYTDGVVKENTAVPTWLKHIKRKCHQEQASPTMLIASQLRINRKYFLNNPEKEDDLTLIIIKILFDQAHNRDSVQAS